MIRPIQHTDAERAWELIDANRNYLREWLPWLDYNTSINDTKAFIADSQKNYAEKKSMVHVIEDGDVCGICSFIAFNTAIRAGYIGYRIAENYQGKGPVTRSCIELENIGFNTLDLNKIEIHVARENTSSRKVPERLGYVETGYIFDAEWLYDHFVDHVIYCKRNPATHNARTLQ